MIRVSMPPPLDSILGVRGKSHLEMAGRASVSLRELFNELADGDPGFDDLCKLDGRLKDIAIAVNGRMLLASGNRLDVVVNDGAEVMLLMPYQGG